MERILTPGFLLAMALVAVFAGALARRPAGHSGPPGEHFDGERFHNLVDAPHGSVLDFLAMRATTDYARWERWIEVAPASAPRRRLATGEVRATFINHATVLLQVGPVNVLTDPVWSERASPLSWAGPRRVHRPGLRYEDLPPIDAVVLSHNHYDHLDLPTLRRLAIDHAPRVLAGLGLRRWLAQRGVGRAEELDWWQGSQLAADVRVTFTPTQHWSSRGLRDRRRTLWGGWVVEHAGKTVYFAGDTATGPHFARVAERFGPPDLALLPIGAYAPRDFMGTAHLSPAEAVAAHLELGARRSMAIHFGTFQLSQEAREAPGRLLAAARLAAGLDDGEFIVPAIGETVTLASASPAVQLVAGAP